ncbi:MAG TPA: flagellar biosynthesis anti-sigma factor FlgM [Trinickia sp.]|uniref:flagellar biosynthesis anti-sigma factor FlgM n=1 Tax=Trinickia sp. TaxID=2571163 RepID=UPI002BD166F4|nr:flagellar biosynthesis anti-sigma factor FlgM [Trinickia sp.]HTI17088.1 flagellar biosynthesis anti-sigma factor FlgM [Trinickia sp.]
MKVDSTNSSSLSSPKSAAQSARQGDTAAAAGGPAAGGAAGNAQSAAQSNGDANVSLSGLSSQMRSLAATGAADIDVAQVESIKQAIKNGTLSIDTGKIADGILETARNLLQKP